MYEGPEACAKFDLSLNAKVRVQIAVAYNYNGDHPKAIALLKSTLRDLPQGGAEVGAVYTALARVYRSITEYPIARDYSHRALESYRQSGDCPGLAEASFALPTTDVHEAPSEQSLDNFN